MDKKTYRQRSESEVLILDGVMGTMLQPHLPAGACVDQANLDQPDLVRSIYTAYVQAGTDLLSTNSFGASRIKLRECGLEAKTKEINYQAAKIARKVAQNGVWVAGIIGPTGKLIEKLRELCY